MEPVLLIGLVVVGILAGVAALRAASPNDTPGRRLSADMASREAALAAQAEIEEHDIAEMLEAQNALRRRLGHPTIGDELVDQALDPRKDGL